MEYWTIREVAESVFACITSQKKDSNGVWVEDKKRDKELGEYVVFDRITGTARRSDYATKGRDVCVMGKYDEIALCRAFSLCFYVVDDEWRDCNKAIEILEDFVDGSFGVNNDYFKKEL